MTRPRFPVLVLGAGRMAQRIASMLARDFRFAPLLAARSEDAPPADDGLARLPPLTGHLQDALSGALRGQRAVILADPALPPADVARAAIAAGCHYLDITECAASGAAVAALKGPALLAGITLAPGCGLAPGYVTALAAEALETAGPHDQITVFVGVLPAFPENRLGYANIWGIEGLVDEYSAPCLALRNGRLAELPPLSEREVIFLNGEEFEAFTTAGSLDALARAHQGRVGEVVFKTLRYPGHLDYIRFLLDDLGLSRRLYQFRSLLLNALPRTELDRVLIAIRRRAGASENWSSRILGTGQDRGQDRGQDTQFSVVSTATAAHVCAMLDLIAQGAVDAGLVAPGVIAPRVLRKSPFIRHLDPADAAVVAA